MAFALPHSMPPFSIRAFGYGMGVAGLLAGVALVYLWLNGPETMAARQAKLATQTVVIERIGTVAAKAAPAEDHAATTAAAPTTATAIINPAEQHPVADDDTGPTVTTAEPAPNTTQDITQDTITTPPPAETYTAAPMNDSAISAGGLPRAPLEGLYQDGNDGRLPVIRSTDRMTPFHAYRRPFTPVAGKSVISIAIIDIGMSDTASKSALADLPADISMVINPYAMDPNNWVGAARNDGHEAWMILPVESDFYPLNDSGPQTLMINAAERQNLVKLMWAMSRAQGYAGFVTGESPAFMKSPDDVRPVMNDIYGRGLGFVDGDLSPADTAASMAAGMNSPYASANVWVDRPTTSEHISASLRQLEVLAQSNSPAIGFVTASPLAIRMVKDWVATLEGKGIILAPLSAQTAK